MRYKTGIRYKQRKIKKTSQGDCGDVDEREESETKKHSSSVKEGGQTQKCWPRDKRILEADALLPHPKTGRGSAS